MDTLAISRKLHCRKLAEVEATPEPAEEFDAAMRRGSIAYHKTAIRAIDRLSRSAEGAENCPK